MTKPNEIDYGIVHDLRYCVNLDAYEARVALHFADHAGEVPVYYVNVPATRDVDADLKLRLVMKAARLHRLVETWGEAVPQAA